MPAIPTRCEGSIDCGSDKDELTFSLSGRAVVKVLDFTVSNPGSPGEPTPEPEPVEKDSKANVRLTLDGKSYRFTATGRWKREVSVSKAGTYTATLVISDPTNTVSSKTKTCTVKVTAPSSTFRKCTGTIDCSKIADDLKFKLTGSAEVLGKLVNDPNEPYQERHRANVLLTLDGRSYSFKALGKWEQDVEVSSEGVYTAKIVVSDPKVNGASNHTHSCNVKVELPLVSITRTCHGRLDQPARATTLSLTMTGSATVAEEKEIPGEPKVRASYPAHVKLRVENNTYEFDKKGDWEQVISVSKDGRYPVVATISDPTSNSHNRAQPKSLTRTAVFNTVGPEITIDPPLHGNPSADTPLLIEIKGMAKDPAGIKQISYRVDERAWVSIPFQASVDRASWFETTYLEHRELAAQATHELEIEAIDNDGFISKKKRQFTTVLKNLEPAHKATTFHPALLLPLRLQTRFRSDRLWVRIYPDDIHIDGHNKVLTRREYEAARSYKQAEPDHKLEAWRVLSAKFGPNRAAWLARWSRTHEFNETDPESELRNADWTHAPRLRILPDHFYVFALRNGKLIHRVQSAPIRSDASVLMDPTKESTTEGGIFGDRSKWVWDFNAALDDGFAVEIKLNPQLDFNNGKILGFDRLIVTGAYNASDTEGADDFSQLLDAHRYNAGLGFVPPDTPTNNTQTLSSAFSSDEDADEEYDIAVLGPRNWNADNVRSRLNARRLAKGLGIQEDHLRYLKAAGDIRDSYAQEVNALTWPFTGDSYFRDLLPNVLKAYQLRYLEGHFKNFVRGSGPLPSIQVDEQPYGIVPVTRVFSNNESPEGWVPWSQDAASHSQLDATLHRVVVRFFSTWLAFAQDTRRVPRVTENDPDPEATLTRILAMEPRNVSMGIRPAVAKASIKWLRDNLAGYQFKPDSVYEAIDKDSGKPISPLRLMQNWAGLQAKLDTHVLDLLQSVSHVHRRKFRQKRLLHLVEWFESREISIEKIKKDIFGGLTASSTDPAILRAIEEGRLFREALDLVTHRVDAWATSFATKRLEGMRALDRSRAGLHLGAYGYLENVYPREDRLSEGYIHAPSGKHAAAAAVLYNAFLTHGHTLSFKHDVLDPANPYRINLTSERVRWAQRAIEGVRQEQRLGVLLGYQFERSLKDKNIVLAQYIDDIREQFPLIAHSVTDKAGTAGVQAKAKDVAARNVVDGVALVRDFRIIDGIFNVNNITRDACWIGNLLLDMPLKHGNDLLVVLNALEDTLDAVNDLFLTESVYQAAQGNFDRAGAVLEAASGNQGLPELESIKTPVSGQTYTHRVGILFNKELSFSDETESMKDPRGAAEPRLAAWFSDLIGPLSDIGVRFDFAEEDSIVRVNLDTATAEELGQLPGVETTLVQHIVDHRPYRRISDLLQIDGVTPELLATWRRLVTVDNKSLHIGDLAMSTTDFLYVAQVPPEGAETELEQRIALFVRREFGLSAEQRVEIFALEPAGTMERALADAVELAQQAMRLLATARPMSADTMCHPGMVDSVRYEYDKEDISALHQRVRTVQEWISAEDGSGGLLDEFEALGPGTNGTSQSHNTENIIDLLHRAAKLGVPGAIPTAEDDPFLIKRVINTREELRKRLKNQSRPHPEP